MTKPWIGMRMYVSTWRTCIYARKTSWAVCYGANLNVRNNNTNNYAEAAMRIMKDQILTGALDRLVEETVYNFFFANLVDDS